MDIYWLITLGAISGAGAGLLAGLIGIGGGIVVMPVVYYGLVSTGTPADQAAHVAVATSLAARPPWFRRWVIGAPATPTLPFCANEVLGSPPASLPPSSRHRISAAV
jgi:hypothetical protein